MLRLIAFLVTGFWPSARSLMALNKRVDAVEQHLTTLTKKHNTLAGSYYQDAEPDDPTHRVASPTFPEDEFERLRAEKRSLTHVAR